MTTQNEQALSRRRFMQRAGIGAGALLIPGALAACGSGSSTAATSKATTGPLAGIKSKEIVFADFGGTTRAARKAAFFDSFTKETGITVTPSLEIYAQGAQEEAGKAGPYDSVPAGVYNFYNDQSGGGAIQKLPADITRNDEVEAAARDYAWGGFVIAYATAWLTGTFSGGGPTTWAEFWDVQKFPGKRAWSNYGDYSLEAALLADGVDPAKLYPLDFARAFAKLDQLRPHMVFYSEYPQVQQLLTSKTASVGYAPHGLFNGLTLRGVPTTINFNQAFQSMNVFLTPAKAAHADATFGLAEWMTDPHRQADFAKRTGYGPGNQAAFQYMDAATLKLLPNSPDNAKLTLPADNQSLAKVYDDYSARWTKWLTKK
jgi:putative spermidine/putrescine transport system substrate-binding protein